ncbi:MAG: flagellar biosynthesis protein FlhA [candidate division Zixibacteria bacterium]|nr:flagellar biosynthesis protein FlhA [candidate division Zixibacteria bacterium]
MADLTKTEKPMLAKFTEHSDIVLAVLVVAILGILILPVPPEFLDFMLALNITISLVILLVTMYITKPLDLSVFPGMLLIITLFRLSLNVASTRLILGQAYAGEVISSFGNFVVGGNYIVGFIIFCILVIIQFVVITKGAGRIAEVGARFTLDAMPGKQMAIDADLNAGLISEDEARKRRLDISKEADFYGAMDGASKFVRGDAIAGILITLINIIAGIIIGVVQNSMAIGEALTTYTLLTVGDGLVTQIPALIVSTSAGIIVTRAASESNLGKDLAHQLTTQPRAIMVAAFILTFFGIIPGMPTIPFMLLGGVTGFLAYTSIQAKKKKEKTAEAGEETRELPPPEKMEEYLKVDAMEVEIGYALIPLVDISQGNDLLDRISMIRRQIAADMGFLVPPIRIRDNIQLQPNEYQIKIRGHKVASSELYPGQYLAINPGFITEPVEGQDVKEPAFGLEARWVSESSKALAEKSGYTVVEPVSVLATHLTEIVKSNAAEFITRQETSNLIENIKTDNSALVDELVPGQVNHGVIQKVLQNLLEERVPIKDLPTILETISDFVASTKEPDILTEYVRHGLSRTITELYLNSVGGMTVMSLDPDIEQKVASSIQSTKHGLMLTLPPDIAKQIHDAIIQATEEMQAQGYTPVLLVSPNIRLVFKRFIKPIASSLAVISYNELLPEIEVESIKTVRLADGN